MSILSYLPRIFSFFLCFRVIQKLLFSVGPLLTVYVTWVYSFVIIFRGRMGGNIFQLFSCYYISYVQRIKLKKIFC